ncbi:aldose epimerase family protein [Listeria costaricensis]|uniref:aldose epimerase family protein n=1 Tax=Listeria costaricensis TaxID=2026604 RepID=UPI001F09FCCD|nr:aldose epimerase family protein [Listeria costaricensis]
MFIKIRHSAGRDLSDLLKRFKEEEAIDMKIEQQTFGTFEGQEVIQYHLTNQSGMTLSALNYGAVVTAIRVPDREGHFKNVALGFDKFADYPAFSPYFGAAVGRVAGRIDGASFKLNGKKYTLSANEGMNQLHGGKDNFSKKIWQVETAQQADQASLIFTYVSPAGENGYPGNLHACIRYTLNEQNEWRITYSADTDAPTLYNPTNHIYFNLTGSQERSVAGHELQLDSSRYAVLRRDSIPTGELRSVGGTVFDFREARVIADGLVSDDPQIRLMGGYDHPFVLDHSSRVVAVLYEPLSGRKVEMETSEPAVVIYSGNKLDGSFSIDGIPAEAYGGITLETQHLPDAVHHEAFESIELRPGRPFSSTTVFRFTTAEK